jgi:hypothetical protein
MSLQAARLSPWGGERWDAMFVSVGSTIPCAPMKSITDSSRIAAAPTASINASCRSRCSSDSSLRIQCWAKSPPYFAVADVECGEHVFAQNMSGPLEGDAKTAQDKTGVSRFSPALRFCTNPEIEG